jgi:hypothetical protein
MEKNKFRFFSLKFLYFKILHENINVKVKTARGKMCDFREFHQNYMRKQSICAKINFANFAVIRHSLKSIFAKMDKIISQLSRIYYTWCSGTKCTYLHDVNGATQETELGGSGRLDCPLLQQMAVASCRLPHRQNVVQVVEPRLESLANRTEVLLGIASLPLHQCRLNTILETRE